jgi:hypothetical protein
MAFGSELVFSAFATIETDPGGNDVYPILKVPRAATVKSASFASENNIAAGTGFTIQFLNYGTAGTAVQSGGTITNALGTGISADVPTAYTVDTTQNQLDEGEWVVAALTEVGGGWQSGDRVRLQVDYVLGHG